MTHELPTTRFGLTGEVLGDFRILREVGRGAMGRVYEAEQISLHRRVAVKTLPLADLASLSKLKRFKVEAKVAAQLKHPNIVSVYSVGCEQGIDYYAMEYVEGRNLAEIIRDVREGSESASSGTVVQDDFESVPETIEWVPLVGQSSVEAAGSSSSQDRPSRDVVLSTIGESKRRRTQPGATSPKDRGSDWYSYFVADLIFQVTDALQHAHQLGVVHRDIKPSNLMLNSEGRVLVTDFGLARIQSELDATATGAVVGTLRYSSPEQAGGKQSVLDERSDIYSLGVTLYELLTLCPLFESQNRAELLHQVLKENPVAPRRIAPWISADLEAVVLKAIEKDPRDRYQNAEEFGDDLRRFLEDRPVLAKHPSLISHASKWAKRNTGLLVGMAILFLFGTLSLFISTILIARAQVKTANALAESQQHSELAERRTQQLDQQIETNQLLLYLADMKLADRALRESDLRQLSQILRQYTKDETSRNLRGPEWGYLWHKAHSTYLPLEPHAGGSYQVRYSSDGRLFATCGADSKVRIYQTGSKSPYQILETEQGEVNGVAFDAQTRTIATAGDDGTICIWDLESSARLLRIEAHNDLAFGVLFAKDREFLVSCGREPEIRLWDAKTGKNRGTLSGHSRTVEAICLSPDGRMLVSASADKTARLWNLDELTEKLVLRGHDDKLTNAAFANDGKSLVTGDISGTAVVWRTETGKPIAKLEHADGVQSVAVSPDNQLIAVGDRGGAIHLWPREPMGNDKPTSWQAHQGRIYGITFDPLATGLISVGQNGPVRAWKLSDYEPHFTVRGTGESRDFTFIADGRRIAIASETGIHLADLESRHDLRKLDTEGHWDFIAGHQKSKTIAAASKDGTIATWNTETHKPIGRWKVTDGQIDDIAVVDDTRVAWLSWENNKGVTIAHSLDGRPLSFIDCPGCERLSVSPDGKWLGVAVHGNIIKVYSLLNPNQQRTLRGHRTTVVSLAFDPDSTTLFSVSNDRCLNSWDIVTGRLKTSTVAHQHSVKSVAASSEGRTLATAAEREDSIRLWNVTTAQPIFNVTMPAPVQKIAFGSSGHYLAAMTTQGTIEIIDVECKEAN